MDELEQIRTQKLESLRQQQMQNQFQQEIASQQKLQMQIAQLENAIKQLFTKDALSRYSNLKIAHPEKAIQLLAVIAQLTESRGVMKIDDYQLKELLVQMDGKKRETKINIK